MAKYLKHVLFLSLTLAAAYGTTAMNCVVSNAAASTTGGARFDKEIGAEYAKQTLNSAAEFIQKFFQYNNNTDIKSVENVTMIVENIDGVAFASNKNIRVSAGYIERYPEEDIKKEITGVIYHEMAHIMQWGGNGEAPSGLIEGIADFVRMKAGYEAKYWNPAGVGYDWKQGYDVTAHFLHYCDTLKSGFVADLNMKMKNGYSENYFVQLLGKPVTQLWSDYMSMYN